MVFLNVFFAILCIASIIIFHELGHYFVARFNNAHVKEFCVGIGPNLFSYKDKRGTKWVFRIIPLGGYVSCVEDKLGFFAKIFLFLGGPIGNLIFSVLVAFSLFYYSGIPKKDYYIENEKIVAINQISDKYELTIHNGEKKVIAKSEINKIKENISYRQVGILSAFGNSVNYCTTLVSKTIKNLFCSIKKRSLKVNGPFTVINETSKILSKKQYSMIFQWLIMISIGIGVINLVPIMPLDGGRILHEILNLFNKKLANIFSGIVIYIAIGGMIFIILKDITLFTRGFI